MDEHKAVLVDEVLAGLDPKADGLYIDATFGRGGHTARILETLGGEGRVLALDRDPEAVAAGRLRFASEMRLALVQAAFADLRQVVHDHAGGRPVAGVLFDLGVYLVVVGATSLMLVALAHQSFRSQRGA